MKITNKNEYHKVDIDDNFKHQDLFMSFQEILKEALLKEGGVSPQMVIEFFRTNFYDDGTSSITFKAPRNILAKIKKDVKNYQKEIDSK